MYSLHTCALQPQQVGAQKAVTLRAFKQALRVDREKELRSLETKAV